MVVELKNSITIFLFFNFIKRRFKYLNKGKSFSSMLMEKIGLYACQADALPIPADWANFHLRDGCDEC